MFIKRSQKTETGKNRRQEAGSRKQETDNRHQASGGVRQGAGTAIHFRVF